MRMWEFSDGWNPIRAYWQDPSEANRAALARLLFARDNGLTVYARRPRSTLVSPDGYSLDNFYLARPGADDTSSISFQAAIRATFALYPEFQSYFRNI